MYNLYNLLGVIGSLIRHMCQSDFVTSSSLKGTPRYILFSLLHCVCMSRRVLSQCMLLLHFFFVCRTLLSIEQNILSVRLEFSFVAVRQYFSGRRCVTWTSGAQRFCC